MYTQQQQQHQQRDWHRNKIIYSTIVATITKYSGAPRRSAITTMVSKKATSDIIFFGFFFQAKAIYKDRRHLPRFASQLNSQAAMAPPEHVACLAAVWQVLKCTRT